MRQTSKTRSHTRRHPPRPFPLNRLVWWNELCWRRWFLAEAIRILRVREDITPLQKAWADHRHRGAELYLQEPLPRRLLLTQQLNRAPLKEFTQPTPATEDHFEYELHWTRWLAQEAITAAGTRWLIRDGRYPNGQTPPEVADAYEREYEAKMAAVEGEPGSHARELLRGEVVERVLK